MITIKNKNTEARGSIYLLHKQSTKPHHGHKFVSPSNLTVSISSPDDPNPDKNYKTTNKCAQLLQRKKTTKT